MFRLTCSLHRVHCSLLPEQGNPLKFTSFRNIHSWICAAHHLHARTSVTSYTSVNIYNFNSRLAHFNALWMEHIRSLRTGILGESCDVHFAGHIRSNRTNIWSDKSNIRNMQSGLGEGARGLELRTAGVRRGFSNRSSIDAAMTGGFCVFLGESKTTLFGLPKVDVFRNH